MTDLSVPRSDDDFPAGTVGDVVLGEDGEPVLNVDLDDWLAENA